MSMTDRKSGLPMLNQRASDVIDGFEYNTAESELIGHKITNDKGLTINAFYMLYRTKAGRYYVYNQKKDPGADPFLVGPEINLKPISKLEAETMYKDLPDTKLTFNEAFNQIVDA